MAWSWPAWTLTVAAVTLSGAIAWREGTLTRSGAANVDMGFLNHGGMWSDAVLLAIFNALVVPHLAWRFEFLLALALGVGLTILMHRHWWSPAGRCRDHLWPQESREGRTWVSSLSVAGWAHVIYMSGQLALILVFLLASLPRSVVGIGSAVLVVHVAIGLLQPHWFCTGRRWNAAAAGPLAIALAGIGLSAAIRLS